MLESAVATEIMKAVDTGFDDQVDFTAELVSFPSLRGQEHTAQDFMAEGMRERELTVDRWQLKVDDIAHLPGFSPVTIPYDNSFNVVGAHRPEKRKGRSLILNGHIDVVPEGPHEQWSAHPFKPRKEGKWLYGRGGGDMKAGLGSCLYALDALKRAGYAPAAEIYVQSVVEEECTGNGALACLARGYRAQAAVIPEPLGECLLQSQLGVIWFQVKVQGLPAHASVAQSGANAIEATYGLIQALKQLEERWNAEKGHHEHYAHHDHPINLNIGKIHGGDWASSVPSWCVLDVRVSVYPGDDLRERCAELENCIREAAAGIAFLRNQPPEVTFNGFQAEGYILKDADLPTEVLERAHNTVYGESLKRRANTGTTDARFFGLYGNTPGLVYGAKAENIHGLDERVDLESVRRNTQAIALFVAEWCGLEKL